METRRHCPLSFRCQEEKCAWWIESQKCCAIVTRNKPFFDWRRFKSFGGARWYTLIQENTVLLNVAIVVH